jgi:hypothetical protein
VTLEIHIWENWLAKPTQGPFKIINVQQLPINATILIQRLPTSVERVNIH